MTNDKAAPGEAPNDAEKASTAEDVGGFFTWANLDGSKYRDYSASRQKSRDDARGRTELQQSAVADVPPVNAATTTAHDSARNAGSPSRSTFAPQGAPRAVPTMMRGRATPPGPRRMAPRSNPRFQKQNESSRWIALKGPMDPELHRREEDVFSADPLHLPTLAFMSLAGGAGKTSVAASIGCLLASEGVRPLLVDTHIYGLLPLFFGARELSPGSSRTFGSANSAPVRVMTLDRAPQDGEQEGGGLSALEQIVHHADGVDRILIDVSTASIELLRQFLPLSPTAYARSGFGRKSADDPAGHGGSGSRARSAD
jgi:hypothetical protein